MGMQSNSDKVVYMKPEFERAAKLRALTGRVRGAGGRLGGGLRTMLAFTFSAVWQVTRVGISAVLVLAEPFLRLILCGAAFLGFLVTVIFGFMLDSPHFPKWGMLGMSVGALVVYWLYLGLMGLFMRLPPSCHDSRY